MNIREVEFFEGIDPEALNAIQAAWAAASYEKGDVVFEKGAGAQFLYVLENGRVSLDLKASANTVFTLDRAGEVFGWSSMVEKGVYTSTCTCLESTTVFRISRNDIDSVFDRFPKAAIKFYQRLGSIFSRRITKAVE